MDATCCILINDGHKHTVLCYKYPHSIYVEGWQLFQESGSCTKATTHCPPLPVLRRVDRHSLNLNCSSYVTHPLGFLHPVLRHVNISQSAVFLWVCISINAEENQKYISSALNGSNFVLGFRLCNDLPSVFIVIVGFCLEGSLINQKICHIDILHFDNSFWTDRSTWYPNENWVVLAKRGWWF